VTPARTVVRALFVLTVLVSVGGASASNSSRGWRLLFSSARTGVAQVYSIEPSGARLTQLTFGTTDACEPVPSPDGRHVIYTGGDSCTGETLHLTSADGRGDRVVGNGRRPAWSYDSRRYGYVGSDGDVYLADVGSAAGVAVWTGGDAQQVAWSRDGRLAFVHLGASGSSSLVVANGGAAIDVADAANFGSFAWSPDGRQIAYSFETGDEIGVAVVRSTGGARRVVARTHTRPTGPSWAPDGRRLAFADGPSLQLVDLSGDVSRIGGLPFAPRSLAWSPDGGAIAAAGLDRLWLVPLHGRVRTILRTAYDFVLTDVSWTPTPPKTRLRPAQPIPAVVQATANDLRDRYEVTRLTANGDEAGYQLCPFALGTWTPGTHPVAPTPTSCRIGYRDPPGSVFALGLARGPDRLASVASTGTGNGVFGSLDVRLPDGTTDHVLGTGNCCAGNPLLPPFGNLLAGADKIVYSTWTMCGLPPCDGDDITVGWPGKWAKFTIATQTIYRLDPPAAPVQIATASGVYEPFAFDGSRLVIRRHLTGIDVLGADGTRLLSWELGETMLGAELAGDDLVVLVPGELRDYDAATGALRSSWPLPSARSVGYCGRLFCPAPDVLLGGAAAGLVAYVTAGNVHVLDLSTDSERYTATATAARLTSTGLFYAYKGDPPWLGRIRFVPIAELRQ
jgi:Tol biopolymer transport system component